MTHISPFGGSWYPIQAADLRSLLDSRFEESISRTGSYLFRNALGFVVPHAGPEYSGTVAAAVYRSIQLQQPERIVVLGFPHHGRLRGLAVPDVESISTPLGEVELDSRFDSSIPVVPEGRVCDHSVEIQLPYLQLAAPKARVSALYVGHLDSAAREAAAARLAAAWRPGTVFLASSDFTHYGDAFGYTPFPADNDIAKRLEDLDYHCIDGASSLDAALFLNALSERHATVCGGGPIGLLLEILRRLPFAGIYQHVLDYQTSGDQTGDFERTVSYAALGYYPAGAFDLDAPSRDALLDSAHATLDHLRRTGKRRAIPAQDVPALAIPRGVFVSLHSAGELLGCVGNSVGRMALREEAAQLTLAAALDDSRFDHSAPLEGSIEIEISVLTPLRRIRDIAVFECGRHGALMRLEGRGGLLLPQVAAERGWTTEEFWRALARKSLLGPNAWRDPKVRLDIFEAQRFSRCGVAA